MHARKIKLFHVVKNYLANRILQQPVFFIIIETQKKLAIQVFAFAFLLLLALQTKLSQNKDTLCLFIFPVLLFGYFKKPLIITCAFTASVPQITVPVGRILNI